MSPAISKRNNILRNVFKTQVNYLENTTKPYNIYVREYFRIIETVNNYLLYRNSSALKLVVNILVISGILNNILQY